MKNDHREKRQTIGFFLAGILLLTAIFSFSPGRSAPPPTGYLTKLADTIPVSPGPQEASRPEEVDLNRILPELEEIDWEAIRKEAEQGVEAARKELEEMDWDAMKAEMERDLEMTWKEMEEVDWEAIRKEAEQGVEAARKELEEIDWDQIRREMDRTRVRIDSLLQ